MDINKRLIPIQLDLHSIEEYANYITNSIPGSVKRIDDAIKLLIKVLKEDLDSYPQDELREYGKQELICLLQAAINYDCKFESISVNVI